MLVDKVIRNCEGMSPARWEGQVVDWVDVKWNECGRLLKRQSRGGAAIRVILPAGQTLRHHDVIFEDAGKVIAVNILPCEVIVATVLDWREMALVAMELGNLHLPVQFDYMEVVFIEDERAAAVLETMGIPSRKEIRRFEPVPIISAPKVEVAAGQQQIIRSKKEEPASIGEILYEALCPAAPSSASSA
jgi:urease accessory protein